MKLSHSFNTPEMQSSENDEYNDRSLVCIIVTFMIYAGFSTEGETFRKMSQTHHRTFRRNSLFLQSKATQLFPE
jgi:hypothetical protein